MTRSLFGCRRTRVVGESVPQGLKPPRGFVVMDAGDESPAYPLRLSGGRLWLSGIPGSKREILVRQVAGLRAGMFNNRLSAE
jgi:hypothetical protein